MTTTNEKTSTTALRKRDGMDRKPFPECHGGKGSLDFTNMLEGMCHGRKLRFCHDNILAPGVSIGIHPHPDSEEYYICLEGKGTMHLDGEDHTFEAGDISAVYPGGEHGLVNDGDSDMRIIVFCV